MKMPLPSEIHPFECPITEYDEEKQVKLAKDLSDDFDHYHKPEDPKKKTNLQSHKGGEISRRPTKY